MSRETCAHELAAFALCGDCLALVPDDGFPWDAPCPECGGEVCGCDGCRAVMFDLCKPEGASA